MFYLLHTRTFLLAYFLSFSLAGASLANEQPSSSIKSGDQLTRLINQFIENNPEIQAEEFAIKAAEARLSGSKSPLNNPEIGFDIERADVNTLTVGISQTLDWHNKQNSFEKVFGAEFKLAQMQLKGIKLSKTTEFLEVFGNMAGFYEVSLLSKRRVELFTRFEALAEKRYQVGDISKTEVELARLSLTEAVMDHAMKESDLIQAKMSFFSLSGYLMNENILFPDLLPTQLPKNLDIELLARNHPQVQINLQRSLISKHQIKAEDVNRKIDPTIGFSAGKEGSDQVIGLSFSTPLSVRNNFQSNVVAAQAEALKDEKLAQQAYRHLLGKIQGDRGQYELLAKAWSVWISQGRQSLKERSNLLETQWQAGEVSTTDYLIQLQQTIDTQIAGSELHNALWQTWLAWLNSSNTLDQWLIDISKEIK